MNAQATLKKHYGYLIDKNNCADHAQWPDDSWLSVSDTEDLNVWKDEEHCYAQVYPVVNGKTQTGIWTTIFSTAEEIK